MSLHMRPIRLKLGPLVLNLSRSGPSVTIKAGPLSTSSRTRRLRINLPGPWYWLSRRNR